MQDTLKIAGIQSKLIWEDPHKNRAQFKEKIERLPDDIDLILLPEMFATGFTMTPTDVAESMSGETVKLMIDLAKEKDAAITGSLIIKDGSSFYNRLIFIHPNGDLEHYDKRHTFTLAGEDKIYARGTEKLIVNYKGWKICPLVCYDLRFPVWARNVEDYDLLFYVANWPTPRITAWDALLKARAIENMAYCIGINRVGRDMYDNGYSGHSSVYDGLGECLTMANENEEQVIQAELSKAHLQEIRNNLKFLSDRDEFTVSV